ncbi:hypothetical protein AB0J89_18715 [Micromonospora chokoriensis]
MNTPPAHVYVCVPRVTTYAPTGRDPAGGLIVGDMRGVSIRLVSALTAGTATSAADA